MRRYQIHRNIRQKALIYGLPVPLFALMMLSIISSLLVIIFSFDLLLILGGIAWNLTLYIALIRITANPHLLSLRKVFPVLISSKKSSNLYYEN